MQDPYVTYRRKFATTGAQKGKSIASFFGTETANVPYGLILLYKNPGTSLQRHTFQLPNGEDLKLTRHKPYIRIDKELLQLLQSHMVDLVVYGTDTPMSQCKVFDELYPGFVLPIRRRYILRDVNPKGVLDFSVNRCTERQEGFLPEVFRLGPVTPGEENNCDGESLILEADETLRALEKDDAKKTDYSKDLPGPDDEAACRAESPLAAKRIASTSREDLEELASKRARGADQDSSCSSEEREFSSLGQQMEQDKTDQTRKAIVFAV